MTSERMPRTNRNVYRQNLRFARAKWGPNVSKQYLRVYSEQLRMSIARGDLLLIDGTWYVTHSGLLRLANRKHCRGIHVTCISEFCNPTCSKWAFKATVYTSSTCKGFVGHGDADPSNVSPLVRGAEMRVAETRAVNRALRKAYGIGICSVEELGSFSGPLPPAAAQRKPSGATEPAGGNGHHPLRDRLCLLILQHQLDPALVKAYAADYCEVSELRQASRERVATFIKHLAEYAHGDREGLLCQLNSYRATAPGEALVQIAGAGQPTEPEKAQGAA